MPLTSLVVNLGGLEKERMISQVGLNEIDKQQIRSKRTREEQQEHERLEHTVDTTGRCLRPGEEAFAVSRYRAVSPPLSYIPDTSDWATAAAAQNGDVLTAARQTSAVKATSQTLVA